MMRSSLPWIISFSVRIYTWLLAIGPADFRQEYAGLAIQDFQQYCHDAYQRGGTCAVICTWPLLFSETITGMLTERFSQAVSSQEYNRHLFYNVRRSMITIFCAFVLFATAYVCLQYIAARFASQSAGFSHIHTELSFTFTIIKYSTNLAFLSIALCGLPLLFTICKHAITDAYKHPLLSFFVTAGQVLSFFPLVVRLIVSSLGYSIVTSGAVGSPAGFIRPSLESMLSFVFLADILFLIIIAVWIGAASPAFSVPRHDFSATLLHLARIPMLVTALSMRVALVATIVWAVWSWMVEPQFSAGDPGISGNSFLLILVFAAMIFSCSVANQTMRDNSNLIASTLT